MVEIDTSDEDELGDQEDEVDDDDEEEEPVDDDDEDLDPEGDVDMDDAPPQPPISRRHAKSAANQASAGKGIKNVEAKELEANDDDEEDDDELSEMEFEGDADDQDESGVRDEAGNANEELDEDDDVGDVEIDSDDDAGADAGKMTKRQRGNLGDDFLQLPMGTPNSLTPSRRLLTHCRTPSQETSHY